MNIGGLLNDEEVNAEDAGWVLGVIQVDHDIDRDCCMLPVLNPEIPG